MSFIRLVSAAALLTFFVSGPAIADNHGAHKEMKKASPHMKKMNEDMKGAGMEAKKEAKKNADEYGKKKWSAKKMNKKMKDKKRSQ